MSELKYVLKRTSMFSSYYWLVAKRDIPEHGVKSGDYGGMVDKKVNLSHQGSCWIGGKAEVTGNVTVTDDAYIGGNAVVSSVKNAKIFIKDSARVFYDARVTLDIFLRKDSGRISTISGNAQIFDKASLRNIAEVSGNAKIFGSAKIHSWVSVKGNSEVSGHVELENAAYVYGNSKLTDNVKVAARAIIQDSNISGSVSVKPASTIVNGKEKSIMESAENLISAANTDRIIEKTVTNENLIKVLEQYPAEIRKAFFGNSGSDIITKRDQANPAPINDSVLAFSEVLEKIASYETDIVKIIKYPVMTDRTDKFTRAMVSAVNKAKRYLGDPDSGEFKDAVLNLEDAFLSAESNARKLASTLLSETEKKQTEKAKDFLAIASNEASSEQEKKVAFKQGFKQLEGIIDVPEVAVDTFRVKIGLKEIEA